VMVRKFLTVQIPYSGTEENFIHCCNHLSVQVLFYRFDYF
jgi:hypothetical protein